MRNWLLGLIVLVNFIIGGASAAYAQNADDTTHTQTNNPPGYSADISKPVESFSTISDDVQGVKPSASSDAQWKAYNRPIMECVQGDTIIPSKGNKILSYLFNNDADTNVTLSILGWKENKCRIDFKEGTLVKSCAFRRQVLRELMSQLLNPDAFDSSSVFAQNLAGSC